MSDRDGEERVGGAEVIFKPLSLSPEMMRAYWENKTQTRRLVSPQPDEDGLAKLKGEWVWHDTDAREYRPRAVPGEFIWWREAWGLIDLQYGYACLSGWEPFPEERKNFEVAYDADKSDFIDSLFHEWSSPESMPKWACRAIAEVLEVGVERVQDKDDPDFDKWVWVYRFRPLKGDELKTALEVLNDRNLV